MAVRVRNLTASTILLPRPINASIRPHSDRVYQFVEFDEVINTESIDRIVRSRRIEVFAEDPLSVASGSGKFSVGSVTPTAPSPGDLWFNTDVDWDVLMVYDGSRGKWTSSLEYPLGLGRDSADANNLLGFGIVSASIGTGILIPHNSVIKRLTARSSSGVPTKGFDLLVNGFSALSFSLSLFEYTNNSLNINVDQGDDVWAKAAVASGPANDIVIIMWLSWRVDG